MSTPTRLAPYERRTRIARALHLRRQLKARRAGMVLGSLTVLTLSVIAVWSLTQTFGPTTRIQPLQVTDAAASNIDQPQSPVWMEIQPEPTTPAASAIESPTASEADSVPTSVSATPSGKVTKFNGRPVRAIGTKRMLVTAYCPCAKCCGKHANGITAAGYSVWTNRGKLVAADTRILPFGSLISVPGYDDDQVVPVLDRGGKIKGHRLDLLYPTHREAKKWGARWLNVTVYEFVQ